MKFILATIFLFAHSSTLFADSRSVDFKHELTTIKKVDAATFKSLLTVKKTSKSKNHNHLICKETTITKKNGEIVKRKIIKRKFNKNGKLKKKVTHIVFIDENGKKHFKAPYSLVEINNEDPNKLTLELDSFDIKNKSKDKYKITAINYKVMEPELNFKGRKDKLVANLYEVEGKTRFDVDINDLQAGDYDLFLRITSNKTVHIEHASKKKKKKKLKKYIHKANISFNKNSASLIADLNILELDQLKSRILIDMGGSSSDQGDIIKYIARLYENDELASENEYLVSDSTRFGYVFTHSDTAYQIELEVFDSIGNSAKVLSEKITPIAIAPEINYSLTQNGIFKDTFRIDFAGSILPQGVPNFSFFGVRVLRDGVTLEEKFSTNGEFEFQIKTRGEFSLMAIVGASNGTFNFAIDPLNYLAEDIPDTLHLNYSHHFFDDNDPRKLFVAFSNQITKEDFKQFNVSLTHLASGYTTTYVSSEYIFDQSILHALVGTTQSGEYRFDIELELNDRTKSAPFSITETFNIDLGVASLKLNLEPVEGKVRTFTINSIGSAPGNYGEFTDVTCNISHPESGESFTNSAIGNPPQELSLWIAGLWKVDCLGVTSLGLQADLNQEIKIINKEPVLALDVALTNAADRSYLASMQATDPDGYISSLKLTLKHPNLADQVIETGVGELTLYLNQVGVYNLDLTGVDSDGAEVTVSKSIEVINQFPTVSYNIITTNQNERDFELQADYQDVDGYIIRALLLMTAPSGDQFSWDIGTSIPLSLDEAGTYLFSLAVQDQDGQWSSEVLKQFEVVNKLPIAAFEISQISPDRYFFVVQSSTDSDGHLVEYNFNFSGPNGEVLTNQSSSNFEIQLSSAGIWNANLIVTDNDGGVSVPTNKTINIVNQLPSASFLVELREDKKGVNISASGNDPDGASISYNLKATDIDGEISSFQYSTDSFSTDLNKPGIWNLELTAVDSDGGVSNPSVFTMEIEDLAPIAAFEISNSNGIYSLDASNSSDDYEIVSYKFTVTNPRNETTEYMNASVLNAGMSFDGTWTIDLVVTDNKGQEAEIATKSVLVDILPPDPGPENDNTLAGIDSDGDGVRDDIERHIASLNKSNEIKNSLKEFSKRLQASLTSGSDKEESVSNTFSELNYQYCLKSKMSDEDVDKFTVQLRIHTHNSKERLMKWARNQSHFSGTIVTLDSNKATYSNYCDK
ncbi:MAG: hypothetical protein ACJAS4_000004 [Bacteriovoracaceae bacterium]|jgi:hypothetical protein